jgi:hypothetical protein
VDERNLWINRIVAWSLEWALAAQALRDRVMTPSEAADTEAALVQRCVDVNVTMREIMYMLLGEANAKQLVMDNVRSRV